MAAVFGRVTSAGEKFAPRPIEENRGEKQDLFVDTTLFDKSDAKLVGRAGRQERVALRRATTCILIRPGLTHEKHLTAMAPGDDAIHHYFIDLFGRRNLNDVNFQFITPIGKQVNFLLWYHYFFLDQATTPYSAVMTPHIAGNAAVSKDLGHEIDLLWTININPHQNVVVG